MTRAMTLLAVVALAFVVAGLAAAPGEVTFADVTRTAGIRFVHNSGRAGQKWLPETLGSGVAFFDADDDGWTDLLFVNGRDWQPRGRRSFSALYRNDGRGGFRDVTAGSGLDVELYGIGVAVGDYDNDGLSDVYLTALEGDRLFHNEGGGRFRDVTKASGIANTDFGTSAAWLDYDKDGRLDLFVANYVRWTAKTDLRCSLDGATKSYCTPESYAGTASKLFRNLDGVRFGDVSKAAGVQDPTSKSLGIAVLDFDGDAWPDLFVANDTQPNKLYRNDGGNRHHWIAVRARGTKSNRDSIGAIVRVASGEARQWQMVRSGSSYASQSDLTLTFGLGDNPAPVAVEVEWPSGARDRIANVPTRQLIVVEEGRGLVTPRPQTSPKPGGGR